MTDGKLERTTVAETYLALLKAQIGQESNEGWVEMQHDCWSCGYSEPDNVWRRPLPTRDVESRRPARSQAERLRQLRDRGRPSQVWVWDSETRQWREVSDAPMG